MKKQSKKSITQRALEVELFQRFLDLGYSKDQALAQAIKRAAQAIRRRAASTGEFCK